MVFVASDGTEFEDRNDYKKYEFAISFTFSGRAGDILEKFDGQVGGQPFHCKDLTDCAVHLLDACGPVQLDDLADCRVFVGACGDDVQVRGCRDCKFTIAARQVRATDCRDCEFALLTPTAPAQELSRGLVYRPFNGAYAGHARHLRQAGLDPGANKWYAPHDFGGGGEDEGEGTSWRLEEDQGPVWRPREEDAAAALACAVPVAAPAAAAPGGGVEQTGGEGMMTFAAGTSPEEVEKALAAAAAAAQQERPAAGAGGDGATPAGGSDMQSFPIGMSMAEVEAQMAAQHGGAATNEMQSFPIGMSMAEVEAQMKEQEQAGQPKEPDPQKEPGSSMQSFPLGMSMAEVEAQMASQNQNRHQKTKGSEEEEEEVDRAAFAFGCLPPGGGPAAAAGGGGGEERGRAAAAAAAGPGAGFEAAEARLRRGRAAAAGAGGGGPGVGPGAGPPTARGASGLGVELMALLLYAAQRGVDCRRWFAPEEDKEWEENPPSDPAQIVAGDYCLTRSQFDRRLLGLGLGLGAGMGMDAQKEIEIAISRESVEIAMEVAQGEVSRNGEPTIHIKTFLELCTFPEAEHLQSQKMLPKKDKEDKSVQAILEKPQEDRLRAAPAPPATPPPRPPPTPPGGAAEEEEEEEGEGEEGGPPPPATPPGARRPRGTAAAVATPPGSGARRRGTPGSAFSAASPGDGGGRAGAPGRRRGGAGAAAALAVAPGVSGGGGGGGGGNGGQLVAEIEAALRRALRRPEAWRRLQDFFGFDPQEEGGEEAAAGEAAAAGEGGSPAAAAAAAAGTGVPHRLVYEGLRKIGVTLSPAEVIAVVRKVSRRPAGASTPSSVGAPALAAYLLGLRHARRSQGEDHRDPLRYAAWAEAKDRAQRSPVEEFRACLAGERHRLAPAEAERLLGQYEVVPPDLLRREARARAAAWLELNPGRVRVALQRKGAGIQSARDARRELGAQRLRKILEEEERGWGITRELFGKYLAYAAGQERLEKPRWDSFQQWVARTFRDREQAQREIVKKKRENAETRTKIQSDPVTFDIYSKTRALYKQIRKSKGPKSKAARDLRDLISMIEGGPGPLAAEDFEALVMGHLVGVLAELRGGAQGGGGGGGGGGGAAAAAAAGEEVGAGLDRLWKVANKKKEQIDRNKKSKEDEEKGRREQYGFEEWMKEKKQQEKKMQKVLEKKKEKEDRIKEQKSREAKKQYKEWKKGLKKNTYFSKRLGSEARRPASAPPGGRRAAAAADPEGADGGGGGGGGAAHGEEASRTMGGQDEDHYGEQMLHHERGRVRRNGEPGQSAWEEQDEPAHFRYDNYDDGLDEEHSQGRGLDNDDMVPRRGAGAKTKGGGDSYYDNDDNDGGDDDDGEHYW